MNQKSKRIRLSALKYESENDLLVSKYTYRHVAFFRDAILKAFIHTDLSHLKKSDLFIYTNFINVMIKLIDYPHTTFKVIWRPTKAKKSKTEISELKRSLWKLKDKRVANDVSKHIRWISSAINKNEISTLILLDSYYSQFAYYPHKKLINDNE